MGGCATATAHYAHLTAGDRYCQNGTDSGEEAVATHAATASALAATSGPALLRTFASLTHRLDRIAESGGSAEARNRAAAEVRQQRDLVEAEVLRRMGEPKHAAWIAAEVAAGRACGDHERPLPCPECA